MLENKSNIPKFMSVKQVAATGILTEHCLRRMLKEGKIPAIYTGKKALINFELLCKQLNSIM